MLVNKEITDDCFYNSFYSVVHKKFFNSTGWNAMRHVCNKKLTTPLQNKIT